MKASELKVGQEFKLPGQRKFRKAIYVSELVEFDHIPPIGRKMLIMHDNCRQLSILKDSEVLLKNQKEEIKCHENTN